MLNIFDHEKLDVYKVAIEFIAIADDVVEHLPRGRRYLADQLQRASLSVPLNIAEGAGEFSQKDKKRFYRMALRSATECAAILGVCRRSRSRSQSRSRELLRCSQALLKVRSNRDRDRDRVRIHNWV